MCNCKNIKMGSFNNQERLISPEGKEVWIDRCIIEEIKTLWRLDIKTIASCCGHNITAGVVLVDDNDIEKMKELGYKHWSNPTDTERKDGFFIKEK